VRQGVATQQDLQRATSDPELKKQADAIFHNQAGPDRTEVAFSRDKAATETVKYHNSWPGYITLSVAQSEAVGGLMATLDKKDLKPGEDATLTIQYTPTASQRPPGLAMVRMFVAPFNITLPITIKFDGK